MPKFYGAIGFSKTEESPIGSGIYKSVDTERSYSGDLTNKYHKWSDGNKVNDDVNLSMQLSIIADPFLYSNIGFIRYVTIYNQKWKVNNVNVSYPRLILEVGGLYNG